MATSLQKHLSDFLIAHINTHGKTPDSHAYIKGCIALWSDKYGEQTVIEVTKVVRSAWDEKKSNKSSCLF